MVALPSAEEDADIIARPLLSLKSHGDWGKFPRSGTDSCLEKGESGELQASQPHLNPWEGDRANLPRNHFQTH